MAVALVKVEPKPKRRRTNVSELRARLKDAEESAIRSLKERDLYAADSERYKKIAADAVKRAPEFGWLERNHSDEIRRLKQEISGLRLDLTSAKSKLSIARAEIRLMKLKAKQ